MSDESGVPEKTDRDVVVMLRPGTAPPPAAPAQEDPSPKADEDLVGLAEWLLSEVKAGRITALAGAGLTSQGGIAHIIGHPTPGNEFTLLALIGGTTLLTKHLSEVASGGGFE